MASQGPTNPGTGADDATVGTITWTNPGNILTSNDVRATNLIAAGAESHYLTATNFGFTIPSGATIDGIVVEIERSMASASPNVRDSKLRIIKGGTISSTDRADTATDWPASTDAIASYGSSSDKWGETWTDTDVNASNFGVALSITRTSGATINARVDNIRATVYYTAGGSTVALAGTVAASSTLSAAVTDLAGLAGSSAAVAAISGALTVQAPLAGTLAAASTVTGTLTVGAPTVGLAGTIVATSTLAGNVAAAASLGGSVTTQSSLAANLTSAAGVGGPSAAVSTVSGSLTVSARLVATLAAASAVTGSVVVVRPLAGVVTAVGGLSGGLSVVGPVTPVGWLESGASVLGGESIAGVVGGESISGVLALTE